MDEDEQDNFIHALTLQNQTRNRQFRHLLLAMPALSSIPYLLALFHPHTTLLSLLSLSSLAATAYLLLKLPVAKTGFATLDDVPFSRAGLLLLWSRLRGTQYRTSTDSVTARRERFDDEQRNKTSKLHLPLDGDADTALTGGGPLLKYLPALNVSLSVVVALAGFLNYKFSHAGGYFADDGAMLGIARLGNLPLMINGVVVVAKMMMAGVDPERELNGLRYGYKGA